MAFKQSFLQNEPNFQKGRMGVSIYMKGDYEEKQRFWIRKKQSQFKANRRTLVGNPKQDQWVRNDRYQSIFKRVRLKKQSQFAGWVN